MKKNKKIIIPVIALSILLGAGAYGIGNIYASEDNSQNSIIEKIAQKFNLNKDDVQKVFEEDRDARAKERETQFTTMLDEAVSKGELTEAQKSLILAKREELKKEREANMSEMKNNGEKPAKPSEEEMENKKEEMKTEKEALEKWASDNGIDIKYLMGLGSPGRGGHGGPRGEK